MNFNDKLRSSRGFSDDASETENNKSVYSEEIKFGITALSETYFVETKDQLSSLPRGTDGKIPYSLAYRPLNM